MTKAVEGESAKSEGEVGLRTIEGERGDGDVGMKGGERRGMAG